MPRAPSWRGGRGQGPIWVPAWRGRRAAAAASAGAAAWAPAPRPRRRACQQRAGGGGWQQRLGTGRPWQKPSGTPGGWDWGGKGGGVTGAFGRTGKWGGRRVGGKGWQSAGGSVVWRGQVELISGGWRHGWEGVVVGVVGRGGQTSPRGSGSPALRAGPPEKETRRDGSCCARCLGQRAWKTTWAIAPQFAVSGCHVSQRGGSPFAQQSAGMPWSRGGWI